LSEITTTPEVGETGGSAVDRNVSDEGTSEEVDEGTGKEVEEGNGKEVDEGTEEEDDFDEEEDLPYFELGGEGTDQDDVEEELTELELAVMKEISEDEMGVEIDTFLKKTENDNTRSTTEAIVAKYNRVMALVAKKQKKQFVPLIETPRQDIPGLLACFFKLIRTKKGEIYNASSLNTFLGSFGRYFADNFQPPIDMKNEVGFNQVRKTLDRMKKKAQATKGKKPGENASRAIAPRHLRLAWAQGHIGRDSPDALNSATYLAFTTGLGCRAVREVHSVTNGALVFGPIGYGGVPEFIELDEQWVAKNRIGRDARLLEARVNPDHDHPETCNVRTIMEMMRRKTEKQCLPDAKFWWNVKESARLDPLAHEKWFKNNHAGKHSIEKLLTNSLAKAGVDCRKEKYTATSARKVMLDGGQDAGVPDTILGRKAGHRSDHSKRSYIQNKDITHRATNIVLSRVAAGERTNYQDVLNKLQMADDDAEKASVSEKSQVEYYDEDYEYTISQSRLEVKENIVVKTNQRKLSSASQSEFAPSCTKSLKLAEKQSADPQNVTSRINPRQQISSSGQQQQIISAGQQIVSPGQQMFSAGQQMFSPGQQMFSPGQLCSVLVNRCLVLGNRCLVLGNRCLVLVNRSSVLVNRCSVLVNRCSLLVNRCQDLASKWSVMTTRRTVLTSKWPTLVNTCSVQASRCSILDSRCSTMDSRCSTLVSRC
jgi:hypothetical protein